MDDLTFLTKIHQLTHTVDTFVLKNLERMNLHEYTTCVIYYLTHPEVCSPILRKELLEKMSDAATEFNEYQLHIFKKLVESVEDPALGNLKAELNIKLDYELGQIQEDKVLLAAEDKLRAEIRRRIEIAMEKRKEGARLEKVVKMSGTE